MGERNNRLNCEIVRGTKRAILRRAFNLTDEQLDAYINRHSKKITFKKIKKMSDA